jgi:alpha-2-macroglobulin
VQGGTGGWVVHRRKTTGGFYSYASERRPFEPRPLCSGTTGADGRLTCRFDSALGELDSGEFTLLAETQDSQGRSSSVRGSLWLYSGGELWFAQADHDRMDVLAEQRRYRPGEVATLQVRSPFREATAWVSVMRGGTVVDTLVLPLAGSQPTITLPIKPGYAPNVFVNVLAVRGRVAEPAATALVDLARPAYKLGIAQLEVGSDAQALQVQVRTDRPIYQTRETAQVAIKVSAAAGALPADRSVTVFAIDEALLELLPNPTWNLLQAMMARRGYGFETASAAMQVIGKRHYGRKALPPGGGGGQGATRELFDTLLLWRSDVVLDGQGEARVAVPINDSLTRFRVVVVADAGADSFGTGQASFTATRDLQLLSGLPATVRDGDRYSAVFTLRNATGAPVQAGVQAWLDDQPLPPRSVVLAPQASQRLDWTVQVPAGAAEQRWRLEARASTAAGPRQDALAVRQVVGSPLNPLRYTVASQSLVAAASPLVLPVRPPAGSVAGLGELVVALRPALAADAGSVRDYMRGYPFYCLEQRVSKAVSLKAPALWQVIADGLEAYVTPAGLLTYYPRQQGADEGYDVLTAFVLSAAHEAGWALPDEARKRLLDGLERFVQGKLERRYSYYDDGELGLTERKLLALEALARHGQARAASADSLKLGPADLPRLSHRAIVQWLDVLNRVDWPRRPALQAAALAELQQRLVDDGRGGRRLKPRADEQRWYWMYSEVASQARLALLAQDLPALADLADALAQGAVHQQQGGGHWWSTQANVWGSLMLDKRAARLTGQVSGHTVLSLSHATGSTASPTASHSTTSPTTTHTLTHDWATKPQGDTYRLPARLIGPLPDGGALALLHQGGGRPALQVHGQAWAPLVAPVERGIQLQRQVRPVKQQVAGQWQAGDIAEVQLRFTAPPGTGWVVVSDPLPPGATVLGSGLRGQDPVSTGDQPRGWRQPDGAWEVWPAYVERSFSHLRAYYETLGPGTSTLTYQLRLNTSGRFELPPTQVEAMYDPDRLAHRPNAVLEVR